MTKNITVNYVQKEHIPFVNKIFNLMMQASEDQMPDAISETIANFMVKLYSHHVLAESALQSVTIPENLRTQFENEFITQLKRKYSSNVDIKKLNAQKIRALMSCLEQVIIKEYSKEAIENYIRLKIQLENETTSQSFRQIAERIVNDAVKACDGAANLKQVTQVYQEILSWCDEQDNLAETPEKNIEHPQEPTATNDNIFFRILRSILLLLASMYSNNISNETGTAEVVALPDSKRIEAFEKLALQLKAVTKLDVNVEAHNEFYLGIIPKRNQPNLQSTATNQSDPDLANQQSSPSSEDFTSPNDSLGSQPILRARAQSWHLQGRSTLHHANSMSSFTHTALSTPTNEQGTPTTEDALFTPLTDQEMPTIDRSNRKKRATSLKSTQTPERVKRHSSTAVLVGLDEDQKLTRIRQKLERHNSMPNNRRDRKEKQKEPSSASALNTAVADVKQVWIDSEKNRMYVYTPANFPQNPVYPDDMLHKAFQTFKGSIHTNIIRAIEFGEDKYIFVEPLSQSGEYVEKNMGVTLKKANAQYAEGGVKKFKCDALYLKHGDVRIREQKALQQKNGGILGATLSIWNKKLGNKNDPDQTKRKVEKVLGGKLTPQLR